MELIFVIDPDGEIGVLHTWNLSVSVGEWAALWPESIFFIGEVVSA
jgi:hypothetical protein